MLAVEQASPEQVSEPAEIIEHERIPDELAKEFRDYFGAGGTSGSMLGSSFGAQLERVEKYAFHARPCLRCGGNRQLWTAGCGFVASRREKRRVTEQQRVMLAFIGITVKEAALLPPPGDRVCKKCGGRGWLIPKRMTRSSNVRAITARPTGSSKHGIGPSVSVSGEELDLFGRVERILEAMRQASPRSAEAVVSWFGTPRNEGGMSVRALWHLTPSGKTMLRRNHLDLSAASFFDNERVAQAEKPDANRKQLFLAADDQALELWGETSCLVNRVAAELSRGVRA